jgi:hypothetical protein
MSYWYYMKGDLRCGPVDEDELKNHFATGVVVPETMVWNKELKDWTRACDVENLVPNDFCPPPAPAQPPPPPAAKTTESAKPIQRPAPIETSCLPGYVPSATTSTSAYFALCFSAGGLIGIFAVMGASPDWVIRTPGWLILATAVFIGSICGLLYLLGLSVIRTIRSNKPSQYGKEPPTAQQTASPFARTFIGTKQIRHACTAAYLSGSISTILSVIALTGTSILGYSGWNLSDAAIAFGLAYGISKMSRVCAILMFINALLGQILLISSGNHPGGLGIAVAFLFLYFYAEGIAGTFAYHKALRS